MHRSRPEFKTPSINLSAYLLANGYELLGKEPDPNDDRRVVFVFKDQQDRSALSNAFLTGRGGVVEVHRLFDAQKRLKSLLFERSEGSRP